MEPDGRPGALIRRGLVAALAVMVLAALHFPRDGRVALLVVTGLVVAAICAVDLAFR